LFSNIQLTENDLVFITNGSCVEGTIYGDQDHAPQGDAKVAKSGCWDLWKKFLSRACVYALHLLYMCKNIF